MRVFLLILVLAGCTAPGAPPGDAVPPDEGLVVHLETLATFPELRFETDHGTIRIILYTEWLPQTTEHVAELAQAGFYDGTLIHRVVDDFVIQGGDPSGTGEGGSGPLGTPDPVPLEIHEGLDFGSGAVGLARWTDDTGDNQWFVTEKPTLHLSRPSGTTGDVFGAYALFAQVFEGMDVVRAIAAVETLPTDRPVQDVHLREARLLEPPDADLIGLVPTITPFVAGDEGMLEVPWYLVAGHPATIRFTADAGCQVGELRIEGSAVEHLPWSAVQEDACTYETTAVFQEPGEYTISSTSQTTVRVLPWHDVYAPFAGPVLAAPAGLTL